MALVQDGADDLQELSLKAMTSAPDVSASAPSSGTQITAMPVELLDHIASNLEDHEIILLSLTCRKLYSRVRKPLSQPSLDKVVAMKYYQLAFTPGTVVMDKTRLWQLLKEFMMGREYAGNYGVYKFLSYEAYNRARSEYDKRCLEEAVAYGYCTGRPDPVSTCSTVRCSGLCLGAQLKAGTITEAEIFRSIAGPPSRPRRNASAPTWSRHNVGTLSQSRRNAATLSRSRRNPVTISPPGTTRIDAGTPSQSRSNAGTLRRSSRLAQPRR
ncbi:hypothetical protein DL95DRAFT_500002 [Leptodontidium sp. 2 PMI_412]|nr:hypothetical protein DL95DRAFT_500002 [Leptodontidium sp. 2 PMI_412]